MRRHLALVFLTSTVLATMSQVGHAEDALSDTVSGLLTYCKAELGSLEWGFCFGYIVGIGNMMSAMSLTVDNGPLLKKTLVKVFTACFPDGTSHGAKLQAFINWAEKHPEEWSNEAIYGVRAALVEIWRCP
jgi:Rap1a immunity proteins